MGPVRGEFDDGTEYYTAVVCEPAFGITTHITGSRQFVETMFSGLRYGQG